MDTVVQKKLNQILNKETTITSVANELGVSRQTLYKWLNQYKRQRGFPIFETQQKSHKAHNKISKDIEDLVISTAKDNPNDSVSTLATKLVTTYGVQLNPTTIFRVLKRNNIRYTPAVVPVRAPTALYVPETIPVSTELPTAKLSQGVLPHVAPTQLSSVTKAATVPTSAMSSHALALPSYFLRQITALVLVGVFGVVSLYGAYQFDGNTSSFTSGEPTAPPNFEVASKVVSVFDEVNPSPLSPSTFSTLSLTDSLASLVKQGPRIAKLTLLPLETYQSFALGGYTVQAQRAPNITNANATSFLDRLSLTVFCSLAANKDASRCSYDTLLALRGTPDTTTILGYPVEETPTVVAVATSTPSTTQTSPRIVYVPQYITNYVTEYVLGTPGKDGKDGKDGTSAALVNSTSIPSGFGSYSVPSVTSPSLIGATTIGYLRDATIEKATVSDSIFNGYNLFNNTAIFTGFVGVNSLAATTSVLTNATITTSTTTDAFIANLSSTNNLFTNATTTNSYISNLVASSSTLTDALLTNSTTTRAYIANLIASSSTLQDVLLTNATTTNAYIQNLVAASSSVTDALFTNATTTNLVATNATSTSLFAQALTAISSFFTNLTATNATTTNLIATNATSTNLFAGTGFVTHLTATSATSTNLFSTNAFFTNLDATNINLGNATTTNFVATNATTTRLFTQNLAVGNATTQGNQTINGDLTVSGTTTIAGNITLGTSTATYVSFNGLINSNVIPAANKMYDLGSPSFYWRDLYADNINVNTISAASTTISGTSNNTFSINSDNASSDAEDVSLIFFRGLVTPNALLRWNATTKRLESNMSFKVQNETPITGTTTLTVQAGAGQGTTNLLEVKNNAGTNLTVIDANGRVGIGSSTPSQALTVIGNASIGGNVTATGTLTVTGTSTLATTTITQATITNASTTNLSATGATLTNLFSSVLDAVTARFTNLTATNATSTNLFSSVLTAVTGTVNTLTGGSITATSSLVSNGTLAVTGQTTLTTASSTGLTATNLYSTNAILTNATTTFFAAVNATTTNATTTRAYITALVAASSTLTDALLTRSTTTDAYITRLVAASSTLQDAIVTTLNATNFTATNATLTNASTTNLSATGATLTNLFSTLLNAVTAAFTTLTTTGTTTLATTGGNVGVGTGTPQAKLSVIGASTNNQLILGRSGDFVGNSTLYANSVMALGLINNSGAEIFNITPSGSVGIGTTTPLSKFHIEGTTDTSIQVRSTGSNDQTIQFSRSDQASNWFMGRDNTDSTFRIQYNTTNSGVQTLSNAAYFTIDDGTGNIGIGTTSPLTQLHLASATANAGGLLIESTSGTSGGIADIELRGRRDDTNGSTPFGGSLYLSRLYTPGNMVAGVNDTFSQLGNILFGGNAGGITAASIVYPASIGGIVEGTFTSSTSASTGLVFRTGSTGQAKDAVNTQFGTERMRITNAGNVGIGTSTPSSQFVIYGAGNYGQADIVSSAVNGEAGLLFKSADDTDGSGWLIGKNLNLTDDSFGIFRGGNLFTINTSGGVGIGTTTPNAKLDVYGNLNVGTSSTPLLFANTALGRIGIGTNSPANTLDILAPNNGVRILSGNAGSYAGLTLGRVSADANIAVASGAGVWSDLATAGDLVARTETEDFIISARNATGAIRFGTGVTDTAKMTILSGGNVGIGTTNPNFKSTVYSATGNYFASALQSGSIGTPGNWVGQLYGFGTSAGYNKGATIYESIDENGRGKFHVALNDAANNTDVTLADSKLTVLSGGNVGIGTTNPISPLQVNGNLTVGSGVASSSVGSIQLLTGGVTPIANRLTYGTDGTGWKFAISKNQSGVISDQFVIQDNGNIGVGTSSASSLLSLQSTNPVIQLTDSDTGTSGFLDWQAGTSLKLHAGSDRLDFIAGNAERMRITSTGNVGIGITNPGAGLEVSSSAANVPIFKLTSTESGGDGYLAQLGSYSILSQDSAGALHNSWGSHYNGATDAWVRDYTGLPLVSTKLSTNGEFMVNTDTATSGTPSFVTRFMVANSGNVGIGTTNPGTRLDIRGPDSLPVYVRSDDVGSYMRFLTSNTVSRGAFGYNADGAQFFNGALNATNMTILDGGNVGIGTTTPSQKLEVNGNVSFSANTSATGGIYIGPLGYQASILYNTNGNLDLTPRTGYNTIFTAGNVGIGTTTPGAKLQIDAGSYNANNRVLYVKNSNHAVVNTGYDTAVIQQNDAPTLRLVESGENLSTTLSSDSGISTLSSSGILRLMAGGTYNSVGYNGMGGNLGLAVAANGFVGIGTTTPGQRLSVYEPSNSYTAIGLNNASTNPDSRNWSLVSNFYSYGDFSINQSAALHGDPVLSGATSRLYVGAGGNVGIGTTSPSQKLDVWGNLNVGTSSSPVFFANAATGNASIGASTSATPSTTNGLIINTPASNGTAGITFQTQGTSYGYIGGNPSVITLGAVGNQNFRFLGTGGTYLTIVGSSGNVGIGTTSPAYKVDVYNTDGAKIARFKDTDSTYDGLVLSGDTNGSYVGNKDISVGIGESIYFHNVSNAMRFYTNGTEKARFDSVGNFGIGTTNPDAKLQVSNLSNSTFEALSIKGTYDSDSTKKSLTWRDGSNIVGSIDTRYNGTTVDMVFGSLYNSGYNSTDRMVVKGNGNVGIGTTNPGSKLEVAGDVGFSGDLKTSAISKITPIFIRGTGYNNSSSRQIKIGSTNYAGDARGLMFTIINKATHAVVSTTNYDTYGDTAASNNLATALNALTNQQIGILVSYDAWEAAHTANLKAAFLRLGLMKAYHSGAIYGRTPYAAIFEGGSSGVAATKAVEVQVSSSASQVFADISGWIMDGAYAVTPPTGNNTLYNPDGTIPALTVDGSGFVGVGTTTPIDKLQVDADNTIVGRGEFMGSNLLYGGDAEDIYTTAWVSRDFGIDGSSGGGSYTAAAAFSGTYSFYSSNDGGFNQAVSVVPGAVYTLSMRMRVSNINNGDASNGYAVVGSTATGRDIADKICNPNDYDVSPNLNKWVLCSVTFTAPAASDTSLTTVYVGGRAAGNTHSVVFDNVTLVRGGLVSSFSPLSNFLGTGNSSISGNLGVGTSTPFSAKFIADGGVSQVAGLFSTQTDNQIRLHSTNSWTGIAFDDSAAGDDFFWFNGTNKTFAIGGGGANIAGKKLHIDGGTTIGANYDAVSGPNDGLYVEGQTWLNGNVGIGTTTPGTKLHVVGNSSYTGFGGGQFKIGAETGQPRWTEVGYNTSTNVGFIQAGINGGALSNFIINPDGGNVGIGTAPFSVSTKLSVNGDLTLAGGSTLGAGTISANQIGINVDLTLRPGATSALRLQNWNGSGWGDGIVLASSTLNVGIGTSTPGSRLDVWNATSTSNIDVFRIGTNVGSTNNIKFRIDSDGDVFTDGGTTIGTPADLAENYPALEALDAGTVVAFGSSTVAWEQADDNASSTQSYDISGVQKATNGYEAVGVVSTKAGITLGGNTTNGVPIALAGRVPVKVTSENGEVKRGDYLTVSNTMPGYAMKLTQTGRVIGRALSDSVSGRDKVMMYIENGYQQIDLSSASATTTLLTKGNLALDANGVAIINIKSLSSANGTWSIDESGRIVAKALCIDGTCLDGPGFRDLVEGNGGTPKNGAMHIIGAHAFLLSATTHTLRVLDIAAGDNPVIVASLTLPEGVTSLSANGTYLYVNNSDLSMLYIVDVTSPTQPTLLRSINTGLATEIVTPPGVPEDTPDDTATSTDEGGAEEDVPLVESEPETEPEVVEDDGEAEESPLSSLDSPETTSTP